MNYTERYYLRQLQVAFGYLYGMLNVRVVTLDKLDEFVSDAESEQALPGLQGLDTESQKELTIKTWFKVRDVLPKYEGWDHDKAQKLCERIGVLLTSGKINTQNVARLCNITMSEIQKTLDEQDGDDDEWERLYSFAPPVIYRRALFCPSLLPFLK